MSVNEHAIRIEIKLVIDQSWNLQYVVNDVRVKGIRAPILTDHFHRIHIYVKDIGDLLNIIRFYFTGECEGKPRFSVTNKFDPFTVVIDDPFIITGTFGPEIDDKIMRRIDNLNKLHSIEP